MAIPEAFPAAGVDVVQRKSVFYRLLVSYLLTSTIPLIITGAILYSSSVASLRREIESSSLSRLSQVKRYLDAQKRNMDSIGLSISNNPKLILFDVEIGEYRAVEAVTELAKYNTGGAFFREILLYLKGEETIYSSTGSYLVSSFQKYLYQYPAWDKEAFFEDLNSVDQPTMKPSGLPAEGGILTYFYPLPTPSVWPYGMLAFLIEGAALDAAVEDVLGDLQGTVAVLDEDGRVLSLRSTGFAVSETDLTALYAASVEDTRSAAAGTEVDAEPTAIVQETLDHEKLSLITVRSSATGWSLMAAIPNAQLFSRITREKLFIILILLVSAAFAYAVSLSLTIRSYRPIKKLVSHLGLHWPQTEGSKAVNEWEMIRDTVDRAMVTSRHLQEQIDSQRYLIRDQLLLRLFRGKLTDRAELQKLMKYAQIDLPHPDASVMIFSFAEADAAGPTGRETRLRLLEEFTFPGGVGFGVEMIQENAVAVIVNSGGGGDRRETLSGVAGDLSRTLEEVSSAPPCIGMGRSYRDVMLANRSFIEAYAVIEDQRIRGAREITFFEDIGRREQRVHWYPIEQQMRLIQSLKQGDKSVALETVRAMIGELSSKEASLNTIRYACFDIINGIVKMINELETDAFSPLVEDLMEFQSLGDLSSTLEDLAIQFCDFIENHKESRNRRLRDSIIEYVKQYFKDANLSLENVADRFGLSLTYLSRFFKDQTGHSFSSFVIELRQEEVKSQLRSTKKTVKEIVRDVGYLDVSNFVRKFKKLEGITPGEYRELYARTRAEETGAETN